MNSSEIIKRIKNSDKSAFKLFFDEIQQDLFNYIYFRVRDKQRSEDILQDSFIKLWEQRRTLDEGQSIKAFLYRITANLITDLHRHQHVIDRYQQEQIFVARESESNPEQSLLANEFNTKVESALLTLSEKMQLVFILNRIDGLTNSEIAERLDISKRTVENHLFRAIQQLREILFKETDE